MTMTIQHHTGRTIKVEHITITAIPGGYQARGVVEGLVYRVQFARKPTKTSAAKTLASLRVEMLHRMVAQADDPCRLL